MCCPDPKIMPVEVCCKISPFEAAILSSSFQYHWHTSHHLHQDIANNYFSRGESAEKAKQFAGMNRMFDLATEHYEKALAIKPSCGICQFNLGTCDLKGERYERAAARLEASVAKEPKFIPAVINLAVAYFGLKQFSLAIELFSTVSHMATPSEVSSPEHLKANFNELVALCVSDRQGSQWERALEIVHYIGSYFKNEMDTFDMTIFHRREQEAWQRVPPIRLR